jgi:hypothetical protein
MENKTNTYKNSQYEVGTQLVFGEPEEELSPIAESLGRVVEGIKLEARMVVFDALHGTHYRRIRRELIAKRKREQFEASIGLVAVNKR